MLNNILQHYTLKKFKFKNNRTYVQDNRWNKPNGLWLSYDNKDGWRNFCIKDEYQSPKIRKTSKVVIKESANILVLDNLEKIIWFINTYDIAEFDDILGENVYFIDWPSVIKDYDGIQILNYDNDLTESFSFAKTDVNYAKPTLWYDTLSCDFTCIWNLDVIDSVERIKTLVS